MMMVLLAVQSTVMRHTWVTPSHNIGLRLPSPLRTLHPKTPRHKTIALHVATFYYYQPTLSLDA